MKLLTFPVLVAWLITYSYPLILLGMFVEGPIVTTAAGFAAGMGYLNIFILYFLSIAGDFLGDTVYYFAGRWQAKKLIARHGHHVGLTENRMAKLKKLLHSHPFQALTIIKVNPFLSGGLLLAGATDMPYSRYIVTGMIITAAKNIPLMAIGYLAGQTHNFASSTLHYGQDIILIGATLLVFVSFLVNWLSTQFASRLEKATPVGRVKPGASHHRSGPPRRKSR